jgi:stage II sporulation protein M
MLFKILDPKLNIMRETSHSYLKLFIISALTFIGTIIIGLIFNQYLAEFAFQYMLSPTLSIIDKLLKIYDNPLLLVLLIFFKNCLAIIACIYFARRTRGISIALLLGLNGIIIGSILTRSYLLDMSLATIIAGIMPHGVLEFPGVFLGASYGLKLLLVKEEETNEYNIEVKHKVINILVPILFVAACIEAYITPMFMSMAG